MSEQVSLNRALAWARQFGQLALDMEHNRDRWRALLERYLEVLEELLHKAQNLYENFEAKPSRELKNEFRWTVVARLSEITQGVMWMPDVGRAEEEAEELSKKREKMVKEFLNEFGKLRRATA